MWASERYLTIKGCVTIKNLGKNKQIKNSFQVLMTKLRNKKTSTKIFRHITRRIYESYILPELLETFPTEKGTILTANNADYEGRRFLPSNLWLIDIPRAGTYPTELIMDGLDYILDEKEFVIQKAVIDCKRIERKDQPPYHDIKRITLPSVIDNTNITILDPMLATGGTCCKAIEELHDYVTKNGYSIQQSFIGSIISAEEGISKLAKMLNELSIHSTIVVGAIDPELDEKKYIVPGLGDAGDRLYRI